MQISDLIVDRETIADAAPDAGAGDVTPDTAAEPLGAAGQPDASTGDTPPAPATPDFDAAEVQMRLDAAEARAAQLEQALAQVFQGGQPDDWQTPDPGMPQLDPFADDFGNQLAQLMQFNNQQLVQQLAPLLQGIAAPLAARQEQETLAEGEARLQDILADDIARNGEFHPKPEADQRARAMVREQANRIFAELADRYGGPQMVLQAGMGPKLSEMAMTRAAQEVRDLFRLVGTSAVESEDSRRATLAGLPGEPGAAAGAVAGAQRFESGKSVVDHYATRAQALNAA